jgi:hypothetical protein
MAFVLSPSPYTRYHERCLSFHHLLMTVPFDATKYDTDIDVKYLLNKQIPGVYDAVCDSCKQDCVFHIRYKANYTTALN